MTIKSLSRKTASFHQLIRYIDAPKKKGPALLHNLRTTLTMSQATEVPPDALVEEFIANARLLPERKGGNILYHEILSLSAADAGRMTVTALEDIARYYLELRAPEALAYGRVHLDTDNPHLHLMISANNVGSSKRFRLSRAAFRAVTEEVERYQLEHYPELVHSRVHAAGRAHEGQEPPPSGRQRPRRTSSEQYRARRLAEGGKDTRSHKDHVRETVLKHLVEARSGEAFLVRLKIEGLTPYVRGRTVGVEEQATGRKHRLKTLGLEERFWQTIQRWEAIPARSQALERRERDLLLSLRPPVGRTVSSFPAEGRNVL